MNSRFAIIIHSEDIFVQGLEKIPGAKKDADNWIAFLKSDLGGSWNANEIIVLHKPPKAVVSALIAKHVNDYVFMAFSGHGFEDVSGIKVCLNDGELAVPASQISPSKFGTVILDCCRGCDDADIGLIKEGEMFAFDNAIINSEYGRLRRAASAALHQDVFMRFLSMRDTRSVVNMYACSKNEGAGENPLNGGYYTSLLIRGARNWGSEVAKPIGYSNGKEFTTFDAHNFAAVNMPAYNKQQQPEYRPLFQSYPFAVKVN